MYVLIIIEPHATTVKGDTVSWQKQALIHGGKAWTARLFGTSDEAHKAFEDAFFALPPTRQDGWEGHVVPVAED